MQSRESVLEVLRAHSRYAFTELEYSSDYIHPVQKDYPYTSRDLVSRPTAANQVTSCAHSGLISRNIIRPHTFSKKSLTNTLILIPSSYDLFISARERYQLSSRSWNTFATEHTCFNFWVIFMIVKSRVCSAEGPFRHSLVVSARKGKNITKNTGFNVRKRACLNRWKWLYFRCRSRGLSVTRRQSC
jgi:hypothetical protein